MADTQSSSSLEEVLKPFQQRATEAEERLKRLELLLECKKGDSSSATEELLLQLKDLKHKLEIAESEKISQRTEALKEVKKLESENAKLQYRVVHLVRAIQEADTKLEACKASASGISSIAS